ncbi:ribosome silencing factor [Hyphomicrobium sp.]|jgi:ribosome-associated protein|uniref:ribosome silencing factor n=1 Tax=Hyphomicrobium sp. TaxID=82 RepID=UPI00356306DB
MREQPAKDARRLIRPTTEATRKSSSIASSAAKAPDSAALLDDIVRWLDDAKAENIISIPLEGKSALGDFMVVASGRNDRHVGAIAEQLREKIKARGEARVRVEGLNSCDWVLIDTGDVIVHVFRPEVREFYNLEKMWQADLPPDASRGDSSQH